MKHLFSFSLIIILMISISCTREDSLIVDADAIASDALNEQELATSNARMAGASAYVFPWGEGDEGDEVGMAYLKKNDKGFTVNLKTTGLTPGHAYTVWAVVFNNPDDCIGGCNGDDLDNNPLVVGDVIFIAGHVAGNNGKGNFSGHLNEGDVSGSVGFDIGLMDVDEAEIHFVVRSHGAKIPGLVDDQISSVDGGCGINVCDDIQFAAFAAGC